MGKTDVLARVAADLAQGHTQPAIQRLSSLVSAHPTDLTLRTRLAAVHRMVGNRIEAGRWAYLDPRADPAETKAFERAYPSAARRLAALRWPRAGLAATEYARRRLAEMAVAANLGKHEGIVARARAARTQPPVLLVLAAAVVVGLAMLGAVTVVQRLT